MPKGRPKKSSTTTPTVEAIVLQGPPKPSYDGEPWAIQLGESNEEFEAFRIYCEQGNPRELARVYDKRGVPYSAIITRQWAHRNNWRERAYLWDKHIISIIDHERKEKLAHGASAIFERHISLLAAAGEFLGSELRKYLAQSKAYPETTVLKPQQIGPLLQQVITLERLVQGESTQQIAVDVKEQMDFKRLNAEEIKQWLAIQKKALTESSEETNGEENPSD